MESTERALFLRHTACRHVPIRSDIISSRRCAILIRRAPSVDICSWFDGAEHKTRYDINVCKALERLSDRGSIWTACLFAEVYKCLRKGSRPLDDCLSVFSAEHLAWIFFLAPLAKIRSDCRLNLHLPMKSVKAIGYTRHISYIEKSWARRSLLWPTRTAIDESKHFNSCFQKPYMANIISYVELFRKCQI